VSEAFPPQATHGREIDLLTQVFATVIEGRTALYVSSPLTTGPRAFEWHLRNGGHSQGAFSAYAPDFHREVIEPNREATAGFVRYLRDKTNAVVIDPTALEDLPGWSQDDYRVFWGRVIERLADRVVFREGWQYSSGCAYEFLVAYTSGARLLRENLVPLTVEEGRSLIRDAVNETRDRGASSQFLSRVHEALRKPARPKVRP